MDKVMKLNNYESAETYHSQRGLFMTSHLLIDAFRGELEMSLAKPKKETSSLFFGRAAHTHLLENNKFDQEYIAGGPVNPRTGKCYGAKTVKFRGWAKQQTKAAITTEELALIERMTTSVRENKAACQLLAKGEAEVTGRTHVANVPCQVRIDWLTGCMRIVDYKTAGDISTFDIACQQYGYLIQQAFYRQVVEEITDKRCKCYLIACEKSEAAPVVVIEIDERLLDEQAARNEQKLCEVRELFFKHRKERLCQSETLSPKLATHQPQVA